MQRVAISRCCLATLFNARLHSHCIELNKRPNNEEKTNESPAEQKHGWERRELLCCENKIKTYKLTFPPFRFRFRERRFGCPRIVQVTCSEELGTMSKSNLRGITSCRRPICGIHSLTLIISWLVSMNTVTRLNCLRLFLAKVVSLLNYIGRHSHLAFLEDIE